MFVRMTDGRVAYTDNDAFFFILTESVFSALTDKRMVLPTETEPGPDSLPPLHAKTRTLGGAD